MTRAVWVYAILGVFLGLDGAEGGAGELPVETFFRNYAYREAQLSPNGQYLATLSPHGARVGLAVVDLGTREAQWAVAPKVYDLVWFRWVNDDRLVGVVWDQNFEDGGMFSVSRDGKRFRRLLPTKHRAYKYFGPVEGSDDEVFVECIPAHEETELYPDLARLNVQTARLRSEAVNPGYVLRWLVNHQGVPCVGIGVEREQLRIVSRSAVGKPWETLAAYASTEDGIEPLGFTADNRSLLVLYGGGEDTLGLYRFDIAQRKPVELLFRRKDYDVSGVWLHPATHAVAAVLYDTERPEVFWADPEFRQIQAAMDRVLTNCVNMVVSASRDGSRVLMLSSSDRNPGAYYLVDARTKKWEKLFEMTTEIPVDEMAEMKPIRYRARDGLTLQGYLTLPVSGPRTNLPLVINPHGGPWVRDRWGFDPDVQFLANRGYAVLRVNFRGSSGYGLSFLRAGHKEWGRKMQDDLTDGVRWAVAEGIADPKRVAIYGGSYGGYATMAGLVFTPELYRCGVNIAGVTDIDTFIKRPEAQTRASRVWATHAIGDVKREKEQLEEVSPLNHVDRIQAPVFLAYGGQDERVPISQGKRLAEELRKHGKSFELMVKDEEGHGFLREENRIEFYRRVDAFLKEHLK